MRKLKIVLLITGILLLLMTVVLFFAYNEFLRDPDGGDGTPEEPQGQSDNGGNEGSGSGASKVVLTPSGASKNLLYQKGTDGASYVVKGIGLCTDTDIVIPDTCNDLPVVAIAAGAFKDNSTITSVVVGANVTRIAENAFLNCTRITSVTLPDGLKEIRSYSFGGCYSLQSIEIPSGATHIAPGVLNNSNRIETLSLPRADVQSIEALFSSDGFYSVPSTLRTVNITRGSTIPRNFFSAVQNLTSVSLPSTVTSVDPMAFWACDMLDSISVDENNITYKSLDGNLYTKDMGTLVKYAHGKTDISFTIPTDVTIIGNTSFYQAKNLKTVTIPSTVKTIEYSAFQGSGITSVDIPDSVITIGSHAFYASELVSVTIGTGVNSIGTYTFGTCEKLERVDFMNKTGWTAGQWTVTADELNDPVNAARYLTSSYRDDTWSRE